MRWGLRTTSQTILSQNCSLPVKFHLPDLDWGPRPSRPASPRTRDARTNPPALGARAGATPSRRPQPHLCLPDLGRFGTGRRAPRPQPSARSLRRGAAAAERSAGTSPPFRGSLRPAHWRPHAGTDKASGAARHVTLPRRPARQPGSRVTRARARSPRNSAFTGGPLGLLPGGLVPACPA